MDLGAGNRVVAWDRHLRRCAAVAGHAAGRRAAADVVLDGAVQCPPADSTGRIALDLPRCSAGRGGCSSRGGKHHAECSVPTTDKSAGQRAGGGTGDRDAHANHHHNAAADDHAYAAGRRGSAAFASRGPAAASAGYAAGSTSPDPAASTAWPVGAAHAACTVSAARPDSSVVQATVYTSDPSIAGPELTRRGVLLIRCLRSFLMASDARASINAEALRAELWREHVKVK